MSLGLQRICHHKISFCSFKSFVLQHFFFFLPPSLLEEKLVAYGDLTFLSPSLCFFYAILHYIINEKSLVSTQKTVFSTRQKKLIQLSVWGYLVTFSTLEPSPRVKQLNSIGSPKNITKRRRKHQQSGSTQHPLHTFQSSDSQHPCRPRRRARYLILFLISEHQELHLH